jgi:hypothetical protein
MREGLVDIPRLPHLATGRDRRVQQRREGESHRGSCWNEARHSIPPHLDSPSRLAHGAGLGSEARAGLVDSSVGQALADGLLVQSPCGLTVQNRDQVVEASPGADLDEGFLRANVDRDGLTL